MRVRVSPPVLVMDFPYGKFAAEIPDNFSPPESWPEHGHFAFPPPVCTREKVGINPAGIRWSLWPITIEEYISDQEPDLAESSKGSLQRNRIIRWRRIGHTNKPKGWREPTKRPWRIDGFTHIKAGEDHVERWHKNARRDIKMWHTRHLGGNYSIEEVSPDEYIPAYLTSTVGKKIGFDTSVTFRRTLEIPLAKQHLRLWGARNKSTGAIVAGLASTYAPRIQSSSYRWPFATPEGKQVNAVTGLIDHWFTDAKSHGIELQVMTSFWFPGVSNSWKGFSEFKSHFGLEYIAYPPELVRFVPGKFF
jgi:hypothetical protein